MAEGSSAAELTADHIDGTFVPRPRPSVSALQVDGESVVLDAETGGSHLLDAVAGVVWTCFDGKGTLAEIAGDLSSEFGVDLDRVNDDVIFLARQLGEEGLLEGVVPPPMPGPGASHVHGPGLCDDPEGHAPDEPTLLSNRLALISPAPPPEPAPGEPRFIAEPPSS